MFIKEYVINNPTGLHARPASDLVAFCKPIPEEIVFYSDDQVVNPKSIVSILSGGLKKGTAIKIEVTGENEQAVGESLIQFLDNLEA